MEYNKRQTPELISRKDVVVRSEAPTALILGGGYAGLAAARGLAARAGSRVSITLVDRRPDHELLTLLPEVFAGRIAPTAARLPLRALLPRQVKVVQTSVEEIDADTRDVNTTADRMSADFLTIALGSMHACDVPGSQEHAMALRSVAEAVALRQRVLRLMAAGRPFRVMVVGAGYTGTEMAGELSDRNNWRSTPIAVTLVAGDPCLLPQGNEHLGDVAARILTARGVSLRLGVPVANVSEGGLTLSSGVEIESDLVVWAAPSRGPDVTTNGIPRSKPATKLATDEYLRVAGFDDVYAAGDNALIYDYVNARPVASSAQMAVQEGETIAMNIASQLAGERARPFRPHSLGEALSLGGRDGAAELLGVVVTGRAALKIKEAALARYLMKIGRARHLVR